MQFLGSFGRVSLMLLWLPAVCGFNAHRLETSVSVLGSSGTHDVPIPTTTWCCIMVICQFMVVYLALFLVRTFLEVTKQKKEHSTLEKALTHAAQTLTYGPMLCVLFIACRVRVEFLSDGKGNPQWWVQACMYMVTFAVFAQTVLVLLIPILLGKPVAVDEATGDIEVNAQDKDESKSLFRTLTGVRYGILLCMYGGLVGIIVGIFTYLPPGHTDLSKLPAPAPSVMCTMHIAVLFFLVQLGVAVCRSYAEFRGEEQPRLTKVMTAALHTVEFGPMMAILFLSLRMRALEHGSEPQKWAQDAMYYSTAALTLTTLLAILVPLVLGGEVRPAEDPGNPNYEVPNTFKVLGYLIVALRYVCMLTFYGGVFTVFYAIVVFRAPAGQETRPISPTMECVMSLTTQYFVVYFLMILLVTASELSAGRWNLKQSRLYCAFDAAKGTVAFAPMLAILFVTTRMYALLITDGEGSPQKYCQEGMFMATYAVLIQWLVCLLVGVFTDHVTVDSDGSVVAKFSDWRAVACMTLVRYVAVIMLYCGISSVIFGLLNMTPENANGMKGLPVAPMSQAPPNPGDLAGF